MACEHCQKIVEIIEKVDQRLMKARDDTRPNRNTAEARHEVTEDEWMSLYQEAVAGSRGKRKDLIDNSGA